ncbi:MAG: hypothetical protein AB1485_03095, partial [Candidatus Thermoplasmatota archaeon]
MQQVKGDGIPIAKLEVYSTLRENRQFAYITVLENSETIDLFLNVASLEPNENITIVVPIRTRPLSVAAEKMTDKKFMSAHNFDKIDEIYRKQTQGLGKLGEEIGKNMGFWGAWEVGGPAGLLFYHFWTTGYLGAGGAMTLARYEFEGVSVDIHSFNSSDSLREFYESLNLTVPDNIKDIISKYQDYCIALINTTTKPPIPQDELNTLQTRVPEAVARFKNYVKIHPKTVFYTYKGKGYEMYYIGIVDFKDSELNAIYQNLSDYTLREYFYKLVLATYGLVEVEGFQLSITLPLYNGYAYFPLGTSPSWGSVSKIKIIFECPDNKEIVFGKNCKDVFYNSKHYYVWEFSDAAPDYDLEGKVQDKGLGTSWNEFAHKTSEWVYDNSRSLSVVCILLMFIFWWFIGLLVIGKFLGWRMSKLNVLKIACISVGATILSLFVSLFFAVPIIAYIMKRGPDYSITKITTFLKGRRALLPLKTRVGTIFIITSLVILLLGITLIPLFPEAAYVWSYPENGVKYSVTIPLGTFMVFASPYLLLTGYILMLEDSRKFSKSYKSLVTAGLILSFINAIL